MNEFDDIHGERLRRILDSEARAMDPTDPLDDGLARIQARTEQAPAMVRRWAVPLAAAAAVLAVVAGGAMIWPRASGTPAVAGSQSPSPTTSQPSLPPAPSPSASGTASTGAAVTVPVYYGATFAGRTMLYREFHRTTSFPALGALTQMLAGPVDPDYRSLWPAGTRLTSLVRSGDLATVTLSAPPVATTPQDRPVQEVVYTLTAADATIHRVTVIYPGGRATNVTRAVSYEALAMVWILTPADGATVSSPVTISGIASVFEATVNWEVDRADGSVVIQGFTNASIGAPGRGSWSDTVSLPAGSYVLRAYEISPKDGSITWPDTKAFTVH
jgi:Immunoglobulin-like domain of bacterial spore germination/Sporulation and spore germination